MRTAHGEGASGGDLVASARDALGRSEWQAAYDAVVALGDLDEVDDPSLGAYLFDVLASAAWWLGRLDECIDARQAAYLRFDELRDAPRTGLCAVWLYEHFCFKAQPAIAGVWLRRARQALEAHPESEEYIALVLREIEVAHGAGHLDGAAAAAREMVELARRIRSVDLEAEGLQTLGRVLIELGDPVEGMACIDEAMLFAVEGRLRPYSTGKVYCSLMSACEALGDLQRAREWSEATEVWSHKHPFAVFPGLCRVHLASSLRARGEWAEAEVQATRACAELAGLNLPNAAAGYAEIGEIRRRVGDLAGAEDAFRSAELLTGQPEPGLALLRLAQGRAAAAAAIISRALDDITWNRLARARLLPARAQIAIALDDLAGADAAADELDSIAAEFRTPIHAASAASTRGRVQLAHGDRSACSTLRQAAEGWQQLGVPHEVATARMLHGLACRATGDVDGARASFESANTLFEQLGARLDVQQLRELDGGGPALPDGLTEREAEVLRLVAMGHTNKQIARALFVSDKTVARHLSNIFAKIGVATRAGATAYAFERGVVTIG